MISMKCWIWNIFYCFSDLRHKYKIKESYFTEYWKYRPGFPVFFVINFGMPVLRIQQNVWGMEKFLTNYKGTKRSTSYHLDDERLQKSMYMYMKQINGNANSRLSSHCGHDSSEYAWLDNGSFRTAVIQNWKKPFNIEEQHRLVMNSGIKKKKIYCSFRTTVIKNWKKPLQYRAATHTCNELEH